MGAALKLAPETVDDARPTPAPALARSMLRFITCGSVDDGKSTLLGRLLFETGSVFDDQSEALTRDSRRFGTTGDEPDYALLVDGLAAEREQGITIDVAYRYFATPHRAFIAADTPGHEQYTRNMATGASTADVAIILVDARKGLLPQTRRHSYIVSMLGVRRVIVAVNKMDLVGYDQATFRTIERDYRALSATLGFAETHVLPLSAVKGDNVTTASLRTPWYRGASLLNLLETIEATPRGDLAFRMPVQWVNRPNLDFRGFSGTLASGSIRTGDAVKVLPRGQTSRIARILGPSGDLDEAVSGQSVTLTLADEIDVSRGDVIVRADAGQPVAASFAVRLLALSDAGLSPGRSVLARIGTALVPARIAELHHAIDVHDYAERPAEGLALNGIGLATLRLEAPVAATAYADCRDLGSLILIDPLTNDTAGLGVIERIGGSGGAGERSALTALRPALACLDIVAADADDAAIIRGLSWRALSGALVFLIVAVVSASLPLALLALAGDALLRPLLRGLHGRILDRMAAREAESVRFGLDGGGI